MLQEIDWKEDTKREHRMSDEEINELATAEWVSVIAHLWEVIGKPVDEKRLELYCKDLDIVPLGLLEASIRRAIRANTYNNIPTIGAIWDAVRKEVKLSEFPSMSIEEAIQHWEDLKFQKAVYYFGGEQPSTEEKGTE